MLEPFSTRIKSGIAEIVLDHPPVNVLNRQGWFGIAKHIEGLGQNDAVRVIIFAPKARVFARAWISKNWQLMTLKF